MTGLIERLQELKKEFDGVSATLKNGMALKISQPFDNQAVTIAKLYETSFSEHILVKRGILSDPNKLEKQLNEESKMWITAMIDDVLVGCSALEAYEWNNSVELQRAVTHRYFRKLGIEREMCRVRLDIAEKIGATYVFSYARGPSYGAQKSLIDLGFKVSGIMPVFYVNHDGREVRENFVYMDKLINGGREELESDDNMIEEALCLKESIDKNSPDRYD